MNQKQHTQILWELGSHTQGQANDVLAVKNNHKFYTYTRSHTKKKSNSNAVKNEKNKAGHDKSQKHATKHAPPPSKKKSLATQTKVITAGAYARCQTRLSRCAATATYRKTQRTARYAQVKCTETLRPRDGRNMYFEVHTKYTNLFVIGASPLRHTTWSAADYVVQWISLYQILYEVKDIRYDVTSRSLPPPSYGSDLSPGSNLSPVARESFTEPQKVWTGELGFKPPAASLL